jgi:hypothetical protein
LALIPLGDDVAQSDGGERHEIEVDGLAILNKSPSNSMFSHSSNFEQIHVRLVGGQQAGAGKHVEEEEGEQGNGLGVLEVVAALLAARVLVPLFPILFNK